MKNLVYHRFYAEFEGATADEVVRALYEDSRQGTGLDFPAWWQYQKQLCRIWGYKAPDTPDEQNASQRLLDVLIEAKALRAGPKPVEPEVS